MLLSRPEMVKPTSQVQRVESRKWVQWDGRTEAAGGDVVDDEGILEDEEEEEEDANRAAEAGKEEEEEGAGGVNEAKELLLLLKPEKKTKDAEQAQLQQLNRGQSPPDLRLHTGCWPLHFRDSRHTRVRGPISS